MAKKRKNEYVNNKDFLAALIEYRAAIKVAADAGKPRPRVPNYIGECVMKIATHLARNCLLYTSPSPRDRG